MFLIVFDLLYQMQEKSRRSISKKGRNALVTRALLILFDDFQKSGVTTFFAYRSMRFFLHLKEQVKYYQKH